MTLLFVSWLLALPPLSGPVSEATPIPFWLWLFLGLLIIGLPILTIAFGPRLHRNAVAEATAPLHQHLPAVVEFVHVDDLTIIEGIGPRIAQVLQEAGITTFAALGTTSMSDLEAIIAREPNLRLADPTSWPAQAMLAAAGDWAELKRLQATLRGGRRAV